MLDGSESLASRPEEKVPSTHLIRGWVGSRTGLDAVTKRKNPCRKSNPGRPVRRYVTILTELAGIKSK